MYSKAATVRFVYVIAYDSMYNPGQKLYLATYPSKHSVIDLQDASRFSSLEKAVAVARKFTQGNPRIEKHVTYIDDDIQDAFTVTGELIGEVNNDSNAD